MPDNSIEQAFQAAVQHHQAGRIAEAEGLYRQILARQPGHAGSLNLLGLLACRAGRMVEAEQLVRQAIAGAPGDPAYLVNLGRLMMQMQRPREAADALGRALQLSPNDAETHFLLGAALEALGQIEPALARYDEALRLNPNHAPAHYSRGNILRTCGKFPEAIASFQRALRVQPGFVEACAGMGLVFEAMGDFQQALEWQLKALALAPEHPDILYNLGVSLGALGRWEEAVAAYRRALTLKPDRADAHNNLGNALKNLRRLDEAIASYREALHLKPESPRTYSNLGGALAGIGEHDEALTCLRRAAELLPDSAPALSQYLFTLHFHSGYDSAAIRKEHDLWNQRHGAPLRPFLGPHANDPSPDRPLRIGYVSPDFRDHCQALFTVPLFSHHDRQSFHITAYSHVALPDDLTRRLQGHCDQWRDIRRMTDEQAAELIRKDQIDILVDLTMHMGGSRLRLFALKPAPVQVAWLAYPGTTGLAAMDYRLTDPYLDPPEEGGESGDSHYSETSIRLPDSFWCYDPLTEEPKVNDLPALHTHRITFGCLNNFFKVNDGTLRLWAQVLHAVPESRLLLLCPEGEARRRTLETLKSEGISSERVEFASFQPRAKYLELYHRIDIGLDTLPYNGHTTSLDAYWMGVPVVSLVGRTVVGRAGLSQLTNLGLKELIAKTPEEYIHIAGELARDINRLKELRSQLRKRMQGSPLMDASRFARNMEAAYRGMWMKWCASHAGSESCPK